MIVSAIEAAGLEDAWDAMTELADFRKGSGFWDHRRAAQARGWFADEVRTGLLRRLQSDPAADAAMARLSQDVATGARSPGAAAAEVLAVLSSDDRA